MSRPLLILLAPALLLCAAAEAAEKKPGGPAGQYVDLQPVALPIVVNGDLMNYVFTNVRINLAPSADIQKMREKEPFFRDALVRDGHRSPFVLAADYDKIDEKRLIATMTREAAAIAGAGAVRSVEVISQAPQHHVVTPKTAAAPHP